MIRVRKTLIGVSALALVGLAVTAVSATGARAPYKPVVGAPVTVPSRAVAGKPFAISFKVTRSDTGTRLSRGTMICDPSVAGTVLRHAESFKVGTARLAFVVPASAQGRLLKVKVTIKAVGGTSATKVATFRVQEAARPALSVAGASAVEGNTGTTTMTFPVTLSVASTQAVSVAYATADGTATAPSDYASASGTITFQPGETSKAIPIAVATDLLIEQDETLTVSLSSPVNATIANGVATGTITNDDTSVPVTVGAYKGATQDGNFVFFDVTPDRTVIGWRVNDLSCPCDGGGILRGGENLSGSTFTIRAEGSFSAQGSWTGSDVHGDYEWLHWDMKLTGVFATATSVTGTVLSNYELNYKGQHLKCSSGEKKWSATIQG